jgi:hypothetical protein
MEEFEVLLTCIVSTTFDFVSQKLELLEQGLLIGYFVLRSKYPIGIMLCLFEMVAKLVLTVETEVLRNGKEISIA